MIQVTRDKQERLFVAGILAGTRADDLDTQNWLLSQNDLELSNVTILWKDFSKSKADVADLRLETLTLQSGIRAHELKLDLFTPWHQGKLSLGGKFVHRIGGQAGNWRDWIGDFEWNVQSLDIGQLSRDFEIPFKQLSGVLHSSGTLSISKGLPNGGQFSLSIDRPIFQQSKSNQAIEFAQLELDAKQFSSGKFISLSYLHQTGSSYINLSIASDLSRLWEKSDLGYPTSIETMKISKLISFFSLPSCATKRCYFQRLLK
jgi:hypothetical protein